ncbi:hypothetical protein A7A08_01548 [Methyloligella halotolerans]|uniref:Metal-binding protein n=1 Tax=Methyloligella halotolerans TaxID=1177755 RepID=A0A1E2RZH9_9HYPH|nr:DUF411 domain-containing protein [Methyloligella halotolerans]ODA67515.1 hypothetical protein A7A08_01548 [Methyloligella halotolerans]
MVRTLLLTVLLGVALALPAAAAEQTVELWKSPSCDCCAKWADHMKAEGFAVSPHPVDTDTLAKIKHQSGVPSKLASCHTGKIGGYVIEGHVPASDVKRLLEEKPEAVGLTVPGMPIGSPGMEGPDPESYDVLLIKKDGSTEVFAHHG